MNNQEPSCSISIPFDMVDGPHQIHQAGILLNPGKSNDYTIENKTLCFWADDLSLDDLLVSITRLDTGDRWAWTKEDGVFVDTRGIKSTSSVINVITDALNHINKSVNGSKVLVIGSTLDIITALKEKGAKITYYDPCVPKIKFKDTVLHSAGNIFGYYDCTVIMTNCNDINYDKICNRSMSIVDTCNIITNREKYPVLLTV